jgi:hypothetical protein
LPQLTNVWGGEMALTIEINHAKTRAKAAAGSGQPVMPQAVKGRIRRIKWFVLLLTLSIYYGSGAAARFFPRTALLLFRRDLAAGSLSGHGSSRSGLDHPDPRQRPGGTVVVRLRLPADGLV